MMSYMKQAVFFLSVLLSTTTVHAEWSSDFSCPSTAGWTEQFQVRASGGDDMTGDSTTAEIYKNGAMIASVAWTGIVSVETSASSQGENEFSAHIYGGGDDWHYTIVNEGFQDTEPPSIPSNLAAINKTATSFTLSWTGSSDNVYVRGYEVNGVFIGLPTWCPFTGLQPGIPYTYRVRAQDGPGNYSQWSPTLVVTLIDNTPPSAPTLSCSSHTSTAVSLSWTASADDGYLAGYDVYRTQNGVTLFVETKAPGVVSMVDTHVIANANYTYVVKARDSVGNVSASNSLFVTTDGSPDADGDGIPDSLEALFQTQTYPNATTDSAINLKSHRPN
jgi:chitodextrinase